MSYIELTEHHGLAYMAYSNSGGYEAFQRVKVFGKYLSPNSYFSGRYLQGIGCELVCPPPGTLLARGWFHPTPIHTIVAGRLGISGEKIMKLLNNGSLSCFLWVNLGRIERSCPGCTRKVW